jgi:hypothetical protein
MNESTIFDFPHEPPDGCFYEFEPFNSRFISIWLHFKQQFSYNSGKPVRTIWGFYHSKKCEYYAPINSSKVGDKVDIKNTTNYTAMRPKLTPLEQYFV